MTVTEKSAGVLVFLKKSATLHYLLLHDNEDQWSFAKGQLEEGEKDLTAAIRELEKETAVSSMRIVPGFKRTIRYRYNKGTRRSRNLLSSSWVRTEAQNCTSQANT